MFRALARARELAGRAADVQGRPDELVEYAHYVVLYQRYARAGGLERQAAFEALIRHAYRMRQTMLVHAKALYRDLPLRDKSVSVPAEAAWNIPEGKNPRKSSRPFDRDELAAMVSEGVLHHPPAAATFAAVAFSEQLVRAPGPGRTEAEAGGMGPARGVQTFLAHIADAPSDIELSVSAQRSGSSAPVDRIRIEAWKVGGPSETGENETLAAQSSAPADGAVHALRLRAGAAGLYRVAVDSGTAAAQVEFADPLPFVVPSTSVTPMNEGHEHWTAYFHVPGGTSTIGLFGGEHGEVQDSQNRTVFWLNGRPRGYHAFPVPQGEDGKTWRVRYARGGIRLLTVPSYFAPSAARLLVPAEALPTIAR
ncbi:hypothetical protein HK414_09730 [Ramlibacter terrae]|uniref:Uncharacterized protein n=1 Tax=Ramlibacter terrae TaxID=2732511 RepID=A0ABX6P1T9_9BURK|nr:hypothetical protein HK414_09730 [Ramlibacter terrae]